MLRAAPRDYALAVLAKLKGGQYSLSDALYSLALIPITITSPPQVSPPVPQTLQSLLIQYQAGYYSADQVCDFLGGI